MLVAHSVCCLQQAEGDVLALGRQKPLGPLKTHFSGGGFFYIAIIHREIKFFQNLGGPDQLEGQYNVKTELVV